MKKTKKTVTVKDHNVSLEINDKDTGNIWVFLHGWGSNKSVWENVCRRLPYTSVTIDLPGFGESSDLNEPWSIDDYKQTITGIVKELDLESIVLVGHSFGGQIATTVAAENPKWLAGLVLVDAAVVRDPEPKLLSTLGHWLSPLFRLPGLKKLKAPLYDLIGADQPPQNDNLKTTMRTILRQDQRGQLKRVPAPIHIIWGKDDKDAPLANGRKVKEAASNASMSVLSGGHYIFLDAPDQFSEELIKFYNQQLS